MADHVRCGIHAECTSGHRQIADLQVSLDLQTGGVRVRDIPNEVVLFYCIVFVAMSRVGWIHCCNPQRSVQLYLRRSTHMCSLISEPNPRTCTTTPQTVGETNADTGLTAFSDQDSTECREGVA